MNIFAVAYAYWLGIPVQIREPIKRAVVSYAYSIANISFGLFIAFQPYAALAHEDVTYQNFLAYLGQTWFAYFLGVAIASQRAHQGYVAAVDPQKAVPVPTPPATTTVVEDAHLATKGP